MIRRYVGRGVIDCCDHCMAKDVGRLTRRTRHHGCKVVAVSRKPVDGELPRIEINSEEL